MVLVLLRSQPRWAPGLGCSRANLGTTNTGRVRVSSPEITNLSAGLGQLRFQALVGINTLSTTAERYSCRVGFIDSGIGESTDGIFFRYDSEVNGGEWEIVCRSAGSETAANSNVAPSAGTYQRFLIVVNVAGTSVEFFINGSSVGTIATNIPTGSNAFGYGVMALKSTGTTATASFLLDYWEVEQAFTVER